MTPLAGIKVLEIAQNLAGSFCGEILGSLGADVIKVEKPQGDDCRGWGPPFVRRSATTFNNVNLNKRAISLDFADPQSRALLLELIDNCDVLVHKSTSAALQDLLGGQVDAMFVDLSDGLAQIRGGALRPLATASATRPAALPQVYARGVGLPRSSDDGLEPAGCARRRSPADRGKAEWRGAFDHGHAEVAMVFTDNGSEIVSMKATEANEYVRSENERWRNLMARSGIKQE